MSLSIKKEEIEDPPDNGVTNRWDDWVPQDRVRKFTDENKELAANLHNQMKELQRETRAPKSGLKKGGRANGSDFSSARGSEERHTSMAAQSGRGGPRRNRDYDLEPVSIFYFLLSMVVYHSFYSRKCSWCSGLVSSHRGGARELYQRLAQYLLFEIFTFEYARHRISTWLRLAPNRAFCLGSQDISSANKNLSKVGSLGRKFSYSASIQSSPSRVRWKRPWE